MVFQFSKLQRLVQGLLFLGGCLLGISVVSAAPSIRGKLKVHKLKPPPLLNFPATERACYNYLQNKYRRRKFKGPKAPRTVAQARAILQKAIRDKRLYRRRGKILARIQQVIDQHQKGNLYLLFGNNHTIHKHYQFFNELLFPGKDGIRLRGLTHLGLEAFTADVRPYRLSIKTRRMLRSLWSSPRSRRRLLTSAKLRSRLFEVLLSGQQHLLDLYNRKGKKWAYRLLYVSNLYLMGRSYPQRFLKEVQQTLRYARQYPGGLDVVANDMSMRLRRKYYKLRCWLYPLREYFSWRILHRRLARRKRSVIAYMWGADHIHQNNIPRFLPTWSRAYSIRMQGGKKETIWDKAARQLGLPPTLLAIETPRSGSSQLRILFPPRPTPLQLAMRSWGAIRKARLLRGRRRPNWSPGSKATRAYISAAQSLVQLLQTQLSRCHPPGTRSIVVRLLVAPEGRVVQMILPRRVKAWGWKRACVRKILSRLPLPPTPRRIPLMIPLDLKPPLFSKPHR